MILEGCVYNPVHMSLPTNVHILIIKVYKLAKKQLAVNRIVNNILLYMLLKLTTMACAVLSLEF